MELLLAYHLVEPYLSVTSMVHLLLLTSHIVLLVQAAAAAVLVGSAEPDRPGHPQAFLDRAFLQSQLQAAAVAVVATASQTLVVIKPKGLVALVLQLAA